MTPGQDSRLSAAGKNTKRRILLIDDDEGVTSSISDHFSGRGIDVVIERDGNRALQKIMAESLDLVLMEPAVSNCDGWTILKELRANTSVPLAIYTKFSDSLDRIVGLEMGADEYLIKPLDPRIVLAHIEALLRRSNRDSKNIRPTSNFQIGPYTISRPTRTAMYSSNGIQLTSADFELLWILLNNYGKVVERSHVAHALKIGSSGLIGRALDGRVFRLRRRLQEAGAPIGAVQAVRGGGFILVAD